MVKVNASTQPSIAVSANRGTACEPKRAIIAIPNRATIIPATPPNRANSSPSTRNCGSEDYGRWSCASFGLCLSAVRGPVGPLGIAAIGRQFGF
jgi:hypothetical protein